MLSTFSSPRSGSIQGHARGFTLIEVLIALVVLSIGLLGLAALQLESLKYNTDAYFRTQATMLAYDIIDRMKANSDAAKAGVYAAAAKPSAQTCGDTSAGCTNTTDLANYDLGAWYTKLESVLPAAATPSSVTNLAGNQYRITIRWNERGVAKSRDWVIQL